MHIRQSDDVLLALLVLSDADLDAEPLSDLLLLVLEALLELLFL